VLTGGASRRLRQDKAALKVAGVPLARRTADLLEAVAAPVIEVGPGYTALPRVLEASRGAGPLAAVAAGWTAVAAGWNAVAASATGVASGATALGTTGPGDAATVLVVATDLPNLTSGLLELLAWHPAVGCVVPLDREGRPQILCARYPAATLARAAGLVAAGRRDVRALLEGEEVIWLAPAVWEAAAGRADALADLDTPDDLALLARNEAPP